MIDQGDVGAIDDAPERRLIAAVLLQALRDARRGDIGAWLWLFSAWARQAVDLLELSAPDDYGQDLQAVILRSDRWPRSLKVRRHVKATRRARPAAAVDLAGELAGDRQLADVAGLAVEVDDLPRDPGATLPSS